MPSATERKIQARSDVKPSAKQVYCLAHLTIEALGLTWPQSRAEASELIGQLKSIETKNGGGDDNPF